MSSNPIAQTISALGRSKKILIVGSSIKSSGDNICAILAAQMLLSRMGKKVVSAIQDPIPDKFQFLSGADLIQTDLGEKGDFVISISTKDADVDRVKYTIKDSSVDIIISPKSGFFSPKDVGFKKSAGNFDLILVLGAENLESLGAPFALNTELFASTPVINISAGMENEFFGKVNLVNSLASSTCEMFFDLLEYDEKFQKHLDPSLATILLAGIISATGSFCENSTTARSLEIAAKLQSLGAAQSDIIENLFKKHSLQTLKIWGRILGNLEVDQNHKIAWSHVTKADFEIADAKIENIEDFSSELLRHTKSSDLTVLLAETEDLTEIQVRSGNPDVDFTKLNYYLGGKGAKTDFGLNFKILRKSVSEIESDFLRLLINFQKERLNIAPEVLVKKVELKPAEVSETANLFPKKTSATKEVVVKATAPENIPFDAPLQPHEDSVAEKKEAVEEKKEEPKKEEVVEAEVVEKKEEKRKDLPDWL